MLRTVQKGRMFTGSFFAQNILCFLGATDIAKLLLDHGADVDARDNNNDTPLHLAALDGNYILF